MRLVNVEPLGKLPPISAELTRVFPVAPQQIMRSRFTYYIAYHDILLMVTTPLSARTVASSVGLPTLLINVTVRNFCPMLVARQTLQPERPALRPFADVFNLYLHNP